MSTRGDDLTDHHLILWTDLWVDAEGRDRETEAALHRMVRMEQYSSQALRALLADDEVSYDEFMTLHALVGGQVKGHPRSTPAELAARAGVSRAGMTSRLDKLVRAGLVTRTEDPNDRRSLIIEITKAGRHAWERIVQRWGDDEQALLAGLSVAELKKLNALLRKACLAIEATTDEDTDAGSAAS